MGLDKYIPGSAQGVLANPLVIDITYAELVDKISLSALIPGQKYRIADYRTAYNMPNVTPAEKIVCTVEPLLVTANSVNTLSTYAYSEAYPQDEIYYSHVSDQAMVPGCDMGYIYRRVDKVKSNDIGFDYRNVSFRRWQMNITSEWAIGTTYAKLAVVIDGDNPTRAYVSLHASNTGNALAEQSTEHWMRLPFDNLTYVSPTPTNWILGGGPVSFSIPCSALYQDLPFFTNDATQVGNTILQNSSDIIKNSNTVLIGEGGSYNTLSAGSYNNTINTLNFNKNVLLIFNSMIGYGMSANKGLVRDCIFGKNFQSNDIPEVAVSVIDHSFKYNKSKGSFTFMVIGKQCQYNNCELTITESVLPAFFQKNNILVGLSSQILTSATIVIGNYAKTWVSTPSGMVAYYYKATNEIVLFNPITDEILSVKEYTALLSETGYAATSGLLIAGQTYYIASYVAGDDFTNVGGTNVTGNTFTASGTTPTTWTNSSILVSVGISAPAVTLLANSLSGAIVWTYSAVGTYIGTLSGAFTENKTVFSYPPLGDDKAVTVEWTSANVITVKTYETGALKDGLLVKFPLTIKVYP